MLLYLKRVRNCVILSEIYLLISVPFLFFFFKFKLSLYIQQGGKRGEHFLKKISSVHLVKLVLACSGCCNKRPQTESLKYRNAFSHGFGGWKSEIKVSEGLIFPKASFFGLLVMASLHPHLAFPSCPCYSTLISSCR